MAAKQLESLEKRFNLSRTGKKIIGTFSFILDYLVLFGDTTPFFSTDTKTW